MKLHNCDKDVIICSDRSEHERREGKGCVAWPCWITIASSLSFISARSTILSSTVLSVINLKTCTCFFWPIRWARSWNRADQFNVHQNYSQNKIGWHSDLKQTLVFTPRHSMHSVLLHTIHIRDIFEKLYKSSIQRLWADEDMVKSAYKQSGPSGDNSSPSFSSISTTFTPPWMGC